MTLALPANPATLCRAPTARPYARDGGTGWARPAALAAAAVALGGALQVNFGQYHPLAVGWLAAAGAACLAAVVLPDAGRARILGRRPDELLLALGLAVQFFLLLTTNPGATLRADGAPGLLPFRLGVAAAAGITAAGLARPGRRAGVACLALLAACHFALGLWLIRSAPQPAVDVCVFQRDACDALLAGRNPYALTFPDVYGGASAFYGPGVSKGGRLDFGYPYPPLSLLLALPGYLAGDFRYAQLAALSLAGVLVGLARPGRVAVGAAALLLFTPRGFFVLEAGWTEPFAVLFLAAAVFAAGRGSSVLSAAGENEGGPTPRARGLAFATALGLLLATKQYLVLILPAVLLLPGMRGKALWRTLAVAGTVALAVTAPLALWDPRAFLKSAVLLQFHQPFRPDALSFLVPFDGATGLRAPGWAGFAFAGAAAALALRRGPRTPAGFAAGAALVLFAFFAFNKQAFCNYYTLVIGALACALAAGMPAPRPGASRLSA